jgi:hypothetical protein
MRPKLGLRLALPRIVVRHKPMNNAPLKIEHHSNEMFQLLQQQIAHAN